MLTVFRSTAPSLLTSCHLSSGQHFEKACFGQIADQNPDSVSLKLLDHFPTKARRPRGLVRCKLGDNLNMKLLSSAASCKSAALGLHQVVISRI